jgi:branched-chain amino acid transport system permease protein
MIAGFFAGIGGALAALNFEIVTSENVSGPRSGVFLLFTFLKIKSYLVQELFLYW